MQFKSLLRFFEASGDDFENNGPVGTVGKYGTGDDFQPGDEGYMNNKDVSDIRNNSYEIRINPDVPLTGGTVPPVNIDEKKITTTKIDKNTGKTIKVITNNNVYYVYGQYVKFFKQYPTNLIGLNPIKITSLFGYLAVHSSASSAISIGSPTAAIVHPNSAQPDGSIDRTTIARISRSIAQTFLVKIGLATLTSRGGGLVATNIGKTFNEKSGKLANRIKNDALVKEGDYNALRRLANDKNYLESKKFYENLSSPQQQAVDVFRQLSMTNISALQTLSKINSRKKSTSEYILRDVNSDMELIFYKGLLGQINEELLDNAATVTDGELEIAEMIKLGFISEYNKTDKETGTSKTAYRFNASKWNKLIETIQSITGKNDLYVDEIGNTQSPLQNTLVGNDVKTKANLNTNERFKYVNYVARQVFEYGRSVAESKLTPFGVKFKSILTSLPEAKFKEIQSGASKYKRVKPGQSTPTPAMEKMNTIITNTIMLLKEGLVEKDGKYVNIRAQNGTDVFKILQHTFYNRYELDMDTGSGVNVTMNRQMDKTTQRIADIDNNILQKNKNRKVDTGINDIFNIINNKNRRNSDSDRDDESGMDIENSSAMR